MEKHTNKIIAIVGIILLILFLWKAFSTEEPYNRVALLHANNILNETGMTYIDTTVSVGLNAACVHVNTGQASQKIQGVGVTVTVEFFAAINLFGHTGSAPQFGGALSSHNFNALNNTGLSAAGGFGLTTHGGILRQRAQR